MRSARFHAEAEVELQAEATYDEHHAKGFGERLVLEIEAAVKLALRFSEYGLAIQARHPEGLSKEVSVFRGLPRAR